MSENRKRPEAGEPAPTLVHRGASAVELLLPLVVSFLAWSVLPLIRRSARQTVAMEQPQPIPPRRHASPAPERFDQKWLEAFYRECGREVTLAYTTLNQMKNWAMIVVAAAISGLSFGTTAGTYPNVSMFVGTVIVYTFVLRFYVRAILCYINLGRWNRLQADCVALTLVQGSPGPGERAKTRTELEARLQEDIENYYHGWLSVYDRKRQVFSNLKLGFALLLGLPTFFLVWGAVALWANPIVRGLTVFALGDTLVELNDFLRSGFFDDLKAHERRKARGKVHEIFPVPMSRSGFLVTWVVVILLSVVVAAWPKLLTWVTATLVPR